MFEFLKKKNPAEIAVIEKADLRGKTTNEIIEEIHETFYTEVDRLLAEAKILKSTQTTKQDLIDKCERLKALGFTGTKEVKEAEAEIKRISILQSENREKEILKEAIEYFSQKYPLYKFITEDSVKKICAKYNLVYSTIDRYIGTVPDANLKQMEQFKVKDADKAFLKTRQSMYHNSQQFICYTEYIRHMEPTASEIAMRSYYTAEYFDVAKLEIAAPLKDFNVDKSELKDFKLSRKIEIPDPVVLQPVMYKQRKFFLIVTAWGQEASDELVVNQKMN